MSKLNFDLLIALYGVHAKSGNEKRMRKFIKRWIAANVPDASVSQDAAGNLYVTKGDSESYPCLCAHMDQVQDFHPKDFTCVEGDDVIFGYSPKTRNQCGLGADDKNGLFVALTCLAEYPALKCAFFVGEEIGCVGSSQADLAFFSDCRFCAQIDRRNDGDLITSISEQLCSDEFLADANPEAWGYKPMHGAMTDVDELRNRGLEISCVNMSCGYYEPHTNEEFTSKPDLQKCYNFVCHLIEDCTKVYRFETQRSTSIFSGYSWYNDSWYDDGGAYGAEYQMFYDCGYDEMEQYLLGDPEATKEDAIRLFRDQYPNVDVRDIEECYMWARQMNEE